MFETITIRDDNKTTPNDRVTVGIDDLKAVIERVYADGHAWDSHLIAAVERIEWAITVQERKPR
jgi:hypothetical protein